MNKNVNIKKRQIDKNEKIVFNNSPYAKVGKDVNIGGWEGKIF